MSARDDHRWYEARLAAQALDLLDETDSARLAAHLAGCVECREAMRDLAPEPAGRDLDPHLPATIVARWERAKGTLRGLERSMVRRHLERCPECREDLGALGHQATLEWATELETATPPQADEVPAVDGDARPEGERSAERSGLEQVVIRPARGGRLSWRERLLGAWAGAASVAAVLLLVSVFQRPSVLPPSSVSGMVGGARPGAGTAAPAPSIRLDVAGAAQALRSPMRDGGGSEPGQVIVIRAGAVAVRVPPVIAPLDAAVTVELRAAGGRVLASAVARVRELQGGSIVLSGTGAALPPGRYVLRLVTGPDADSVLHAPESVEYPFTLRRSP
jgi:hypothetical protein